MHACIYTKRCIDDGKARARACHGMQVYIRLTYSMVQQHTVWAVMTRDGGPFSDIALHAAAQDEDAAAAYFGGKRLTNVRQP